jgi:hypothetical protein
MIETQNLASLRWQTSQLGATIVEQEDRKTFLKALKNIPRL